MQDLPATLRRLGIPRDGVLLVHNAFKQLGREGFVPYQVAADLANYMATGTLLLPTMSWRYVKPSQPVFDELATPSNTGVLTEVFRTRYATRRSLHPTHSVAGLGASADSFLNEHHLDPTPCSERSPFGKLVVADGWILMLGIGFDCCTVVHHGEEVVAPERYLRPDSAVESYTCIDRFGTKHPVKLRRHLLLPRDYWQFQDALHRQGKLRLGYLGTVVCRAFRAADLNAIVLSTLKTRPDAIIARSMQRYRIM